MSIPEFIVKEEPTAKQKEFKEMLNGLFNKMPDTQKKEFAEDGFIGALSAIFKTMVGSENHEKIDVLVNSNIPAKPKNNQIT